MTNITYRQFTEGDALEVRSVAIAAWKHTYAHIFDLPFIESFILTNYSPDKLSALLPALTSGEMFFELAISCSQIIGFSNITDRGQEMELCRIYLLPEYIGKGIGKNLLQLGENFILAKGQNRYFCYVHKDNEQGKMFYQKNGFQHIAERDSVDEWYLHKTLTLEFFKTNPSLV